MTASSEQAMTIAKARFDDIATKSREAMEMGLKAVDVAAATSRGNVDALLESSRMASGALEAIARDVADYAKQRADRTTGRPRGTQAASQTTQTYFCGTADVPGFVHALQGTGACPRRSIKNELTGYQIQ